MPENFVKYAKVNQIPICFINSYLVHEETRIEPFIYLATHNRKDIVLARLRNDMETYHRLTSGIAEKQKAALHGRMFMYTALPAGGANETHKEDDGNAQNKT